MKKYKIFETNTEVANDIERDYHVTIKGKKQIIADTVTFANCTMSAFNNVLKQKGFAHFSEFKKLKIFVH